MSTAGIVWVCLGAAVLVVLIASGNRRVVKQTLLGFAVLLAAALIIGGAYVVLAWHDGALQVRLLDHWFGPR